MRRIIRMLVKCVVRMMIIVVIIAVVMLFIAMLFNSPTMYIQRMTGFLCCQTPIRKYSYDDVGEGKEFDRIDIYRLKRHDAKRIASFANSSDEWNSLPLDDGSQFDGMADLRFDQHMEDMITCQEGYWYSSDNLPRVLCVFDSENNKLFIRMRTW